MLASTQDVVTCLVTYSDWWQPASASVLKVARAKADKNFGDGLNPGLVESLDVRFELGRRMALIDERDRYLLFLWYVRQLHVDDVAKEMGLSRRQCFRLKANAIRALTLEEPAKSAR